MHTLEELLEELQTDSATKVRIISGEYSRSADPGVASESASRTHGDLAATTVAEDADDLKNVANQPKPSGVITSVSRDEALLLIKHGATTKLNLE